MKSNSIDYINQKNTIKSVKVNLINNIPKSKINKKDKQRMRNKASNNPINSNFNNHHINYGLISNKGNNNLIKNVSNYIYLNKSILLSAYEESLTILFDNLKNYMKNDILYYNTLKDNFIKNVKNIYQKNKNNFSFISTNNKNITKKEEIKIDNYFSSKTYKKNNKMKTNYENAFHKKNKSHINKSISKIISNISNNSINKSNISIQNIKSNKNLRKVDISKINKKKESINNKNSLYSLIKASNRQLISNSPIKDKIKKNYKCSMLNNFINFNKKTKKKHSSNTQNYSIFKSEIMKNGKDINNQLIKKNNSTNLKSIDKKEFNNYISNNINNKIYCNNIINKIPDTINKEKYEINNDLINCIKNTLDENLKGIFDFSYESFLNKESERE